MQEIFAEEISRVDPGFFLRMKESKYYPEDKRDIQGNCPELPYTLFVDKTFTDKDFHKKYPTIYHLRKMLMETEDTPDMRLVYLALHHMMKHTVKHWQLLIMMRSISCMVNFSRFLQIRQHLYLSKIRLTLLRISEMKRWILKLNWMKVRFR